MKRSDHDKSSSDCTVVKKRAKIGDEIERTKFNGIIIELKLKKKKEKNWRKLLTMCKNCVVKENEP